LIGELLRRQQLDLLSLAFCLGGVVNQSCCANSREVLGPSVLDSIERQLPKSQSANSKFLTFVSEKKRADRLNILAFRYPAVTHQLRFFFWRAIMA